MEEKPKPKTYRGSCHCGNYVFEAQLPEIESAAHCNCSICHKKGVLWVFPDRASFTLVRGEEETMTHYTFGKKLVDHMARRSVVRCPAGAPRLTQRTQFCGNCGTSLLGRGFLKPPGPDEEPEFGINVCPRQPPPKEHKTRKG